MSSAARNKAFLVMGSFVALAVAAFAVGNANAAPAKPAPRGGGGPSPSGPPPGGGGAQPGEPPASPPSQWGMEELLKRAAEKSRPAGTGEAEQGKKPVADPNKAPQEASLGGTEPQGNQARAQIPSGGESQLARSAGDAMQDKGGGAGSGGGMSLANMMGFGAQSAGV